MRISLFFLLTVLITMPLAHAGKILKCHTHESFEFPDAGAFVLGYVDMKADCQDPQGHEFEVAFSGKSLGAGASLTGEVVMTENYTMNTTRAFLLACPFSKKASFEKPKTFAFAVLEAGVFFGAIAGVGFDKKASPCLIAGGGGVIIGALAEFSKVTVTPLRQIDID